MSCLSIIIPVYNAEKYLNKCIDSILNQSFKDFELLLIDDGSKDLSGKICDKYAEVDERVKVFHIQNGGPAKARNLGIKYATGIYIEFVDADDELIPEALENLYILTKNNPDIIIADSQIITADEKVKNIISIEKNDQINVEEYLKNLNTVRKATLLHYIWNKWYKRELICENRIIFDENERLGEDFLFNCEIIDKADCVWGTDILLYKYYKRDNGSLSGKYIENELSRRRKMDSTFLQLYENKKIKEECYNLISRMIGSITLASIQGVFMPGSPDNLKEKKLYVQEFLNSEYLNYINFYSQNKGLTKSEKIASILLKNKWIYLYLILFGLLKGDRSGKKAKQ
ncbi:MAG: glycosyltransferase [Clostridiales bacterium]|nr:glycosyltransferase [Clostridiales bacterium]